MVTASRGFQRFHFTPSFEAIVDPEFPGDGNWGCPVHGFCRDGEATERFDSVWGSPLVVEVLPFGGGRWVGHYASGGLGGVSGVFATPNPSQLGVATDGLISFTSVDDPGAGAAVVRDAVQQIVAVADRPVLLLVGFSEMAAIDSQGVAWETPRLAVDDLKVISTSGGSIECTLDNLGGSATISLDASNGEQIVGTRLDSFWPPDALA